MKSTYNKAARAIALTAAMSFSFSCKEEFLKPDPLSFYEPTNTFTTKAGLQAAITANIRNMRYIWYGEASPLLTENLFSDVAVEGTTDKSGPAQDINQLVTPTSDNNNDNTNKISWFWYEGYKGIKYANSIISNIDRVEGLDAKVRNQMLGAAYFQRAFRYYFMVFQFGDIPFLTKEVNTPKFNYKSTKRSVIIAKMISDLEFAVQNVPAAVDYGDVNKAACQHLLVKFYLAAGNFDKAIEVANAVITGSGYSLMQSNFGTFVNPAPAVHPITRNVIWDLHRPQNKSIPANKETIFNAISREDFINSRLDLATMRAATPFLSGTSNQLVNTPTGRSGMSYSYTATNGKIDLRKTYGRGIGRSRPTWYATNGVWDDPNDLRHSSANGNWVRMEDLVYNNPSLQTANDTWYGKPLVKFSPTTGKPLVNDTIRCWFDWPHYKLFIESPRAETVDNYSGGAADWYIYRLAETYLLRAEANFWKGNLAAAADDVNAVRRRAGCTRLYTAATINAGAIMDERARELTFEELRHVELSRVSYIFALTRKTDEFGKSYTEQGLPQSSYWYERVMKYNNFYNKGVKTTYGATFTISPYHLFWPVPQKDIDANRLAVINQNFGYTGYAKNVVPNQTLEEALENENN
ncbi:RagB/SusD family nutrient uptake outer membrane protein [Hufsiella ginkgonis]|uniref:RagB/SusD family nutrient uptake outer membrane protein n=1 Tax=Hufsiella ginkgonis TaxID=2695274 RepID=A0A7K1XS83_9SPHI|nr:RagB/SusD family nutrient uptake outer membrane protein [Hufsiella ginkgonis]MXV13804.1 RagB/SusD family nutrient uptake outer membrane protein [Hufsiella ginkgonis]